MQKTFLEKKSKCIVLLTLFLYTFSISCTEKSFLCWDEKRKKAMAFSYDNVSQTITVRDIHSYSAFTSSKEPLSSDMPGGIHRLQMDEDVITLEVIQYVASERVQLPSGKFIGGDITFKNEDEYLKQTRYHAVYATVEKYMFDRNFVKLYYSSTSLPKPRSAIEQKYIYDQRTGEYHFVKTKDLTDKEFALLFNKEVYEEIYPHCEEESYSLKRILRSILKNLSFP